MDSNMIMHAVSAKTLSQTNNAPLMTTATK